MISSAMVLLIGHCPNRLLAAPDVSPMPPVDETLDRPAAILLRRNTSLAGSAFLTSGAGAGGGVAGVAGPPPIRPTPAIS